MFKAEALVADSMGFHTVGGSLAVGRASLRHRRRFQKQVGVQTQERLFFYVGQSSICVHISWPTCRSLARGDASRRQAGNYRDARVRHVKIRHTFNSNSH